MTILKKWWFWVLLILVLIILYLILGYVFKIVPVYRCTSVNRLGGIIKFCGWNRGDIVG